METQDTGRLVCQTGSFLSGEDSSAYTCFGSHLQPDGTFFRVWAPNAQKVWVTGSFCGWETERFPMEEKADGVWEAFVPGAGRYDTYKYAIRTRDGSLIQKADPYAFHSETPPRNASKIYDPFRYRWGDEGWEARRESLWDPQTPVHLYQLHLSSFHTYASGEPLNYRIVAEHGLPYFRKMGYTHLEFLPVLEYPDDGSAGFYPDCFFAPTSRGGAPEDLFFLIDACHKEGIPVVLGFTPLCFATSESGPEGFDGEPLYKAAGGWDDPRSRAFDFEKGGVVSFLLSSAAFLFEGLHADGLRLYGADRIAQRPGGKAFLEKLVRMVKSRFPGRKLLSGSEDFCKEAGEIAVYEDTRTVEALFGPFEEPFESRRAAPLPLPSQPALWSIPLSLYYSEKGTLAERVWGSYDEKFSGLRAFRTLFAALGGGRLTCMGSEVAQSVLWNPRHEPDWFLLDYEMHRKYQTFIQALNAFCLKTPGMWQWSPPSPVPVSGDRVFAFLRKDAAGGELLILTNLSDQPAPQTAAGVSRRGKYNLLFSSSDPSFGGRERTNLNFFTKLTPFGDCPYHIEADLPPLTTLYLYRNPPSLKEGGEPG